VHPVEEIVALELVPDVVAAARQDFGALNAGVVGDARVRVVSDDGRSHLFASPGAFDVVVGDLLVPWRPGEASLYTLEHFTSVRRALRPHGVFCQWLPVYQLSEPQLASLARTFAEVFPEATLWRGNFLAGEPTLALVGQRDGEALDVEGIDRRAAALAPAVDASQPLLKHPSGVWLFLVGVLDQQAALLARAARNTDDEPSVELDSPRNRVPFGGRELEDFLRRVTAAPQAPRALARLDAMHAGWRDTGNALAEAALQTGPAGEAQVLTLLRTLPAELQQALDVPR
jgi:spermidine synthase